MNLYAGHVNTPSVMAWCWVRSSASVSMVSYSSRKVSPKKGAAAAQSAIKVHQREPDYCRERNVYFRLKDNEVSAIRGCHVPQLLRYDDELWVIEMTVVSRPFVLDFAGAFLDKAPDFSDEVLADWRADKKDQFGKHWAEVEAILRQLASYGVHVVDVSPSNVCLAD